MTAIRTAVVGAGVSGLVAAIELSTLGCDVVLIERAATTGGKMRTQIIDGRPVDAGPTVLTMRWVLDQILADAGENLSELVKLQPLTTLARHWWSRGPRLDLLASVDGTAENIGGFAGRKEADGFRAMARRAKSIYDTLELPFMRSSQPTPVSLALGAGISGLGDLVRISPFTTLWKALGEHYRDVRLRQMFARYATYCGSSPFLAPATLMLIAHVEQEGVWVVDGGMHGIAEALTAVARRRGVEIRLGAEVAEIEARRGVVTGLRLADGERIACDGVVVTADTEALASGRFGDAVSRVVPRRAVSARSLSAVTWTAVTETAGVPLVRHNVFFSDDYEAEFGEISRGRLPSDPTIYICAQDRADGADVTPPGAERLLVLVNAPPTGDRHAFDAQEIAACQQRVTTSLERRGLKLQLEGTHSRVTTPAMFEQLFPATGGALYGQATHGWAASFNRPHARTKLKGLYLAGGSVHPGPGVPMAAISGWLAAHSLISDRISPGKFHRVVMPGGMSTR